MCYFFVTLEANTTSVMTFKMLGEYLQSICCLCVEIMCGKIELVTADTHGNVAVWTPKGDLIWEKHLKSLIPQVTCYHNLS